MQTPREFVAQLILSSEALRRARTKGGGGNDRATLLDELRHLFNPEGGNG